MNNRRIHLRTAGRSAFTLIELLLVMVILVVLAAVVVPKFADRSKQARENAAKADIAMISTALDAFEIDNGRYPTSEEGLGSLIANPGNLLNWHGPYINKSAMRADPWGTPYVYQYPGQHKQGSFDLYSFGADLREGNDDFTNWDQ